jgi:carbon monoxide dehydrogenase subunit G
MKASGYRRDLVPQEPIQCWPHTTGEERWMAEATAELAMSTSPDKVWETVRDFHGLGNWMPGIDSSRSEGDDRILSMMGMEIREHLVGIDDAKRAITYSITDGAPVESHRATITVHEDGTGSKVTWDVDAKPDEMAGLMQGIYQQSLEALKTQVGG